MGVKKCFSTKFLLFVPLTENKFLYMELFKYILHSFFFVYQELSDISLGLNLIKLECRNIIVFFIIPLERRKQELPVLPIEIMLLSLWKISQCHANPTNMHKHGIDLEKLKNSCLYLDRWQKNCYNSVKSCSV